MIPILCVLLEVQNLLNVETVSVIGLLLAAVYVLIKYIERQETKFNKAIDAKTAEHEKETEKVEKRVSELIEANNRLQEEKYQITREVIPLLIELIQKLNKDEQH